MRTSFRVFIIIILILITTRSCCHPNLLLLNVLVRSTVGLIFVSWIAAPLITGIIGAIFFWFIRKFILRSDAPYKRSVAIYPITIFLAVGLDLFMVLYKAGRNNPQIKEWGLAFQIPVAWGSSAVLAVFFYFVLGPMLERRIAAKFDKEAQHLEMVDAEEGVPQDVNVESTEPGGTAAGSTADFVSPSCGATDMTRSERTKVSTMSDDKNSDDDMDENGKNNEEKPKNSKSLRSMASKSLRKFADSTINRDIEAEGKDTQSGVSTECY